jgi:hypothetical protein
VASARLSFRCSVPSIPSAAEFLMPLTVGTSFLRPGSFGAMPFRIDVSFGNGHHYRVQPTTSGLAGARGNQFL